MARRRVGLLAVLTMLTVAMTSTAYGQTAGVSLSGTVTDDSQGVLPGVSVTVTQTDTGATRTVVTGSNGDYLFTNLPIGPYTIAATLSGFNKFEQTGIVLNVGDTRSVNISLKIGAMSETVSVQADANLVQSRSLSVGQVTQQELIVGLPLNGRSATQLLVLAGGAVDQGTSGPGRLYPGAANISVAGGSANSTQYLVDGGYNNNPDGNQGNVIPFPDALEEFRTESGVRDARFGMSSSATVNAATKSGSNSFRGNLFEFMRNHNFNALQFFDKVENGGTGLDDGLKRDQFGGTIGGPIVRNKLFFFFGAQITRNIVFPTSNQTVFTEEMLRGDFRRVVSPPCVPTARTLGAPFVDNQIDPAMFHPLSLRIAAMVPGPDPAFDPDGCGRYLYRGDDSSTDQQYVTRVDLQMTKNTRVFFRDFMTFFSDPPAFDLDNSNLIDATGAGSGNNASMHTIATGFDVIISPNLLSSTRFSYQHTFAERTNGAGVPTLGTLGVNTWQYTTGRIPGQDMLKAGLFNSANTGVFYARTPQFSQDFEWMRGSHSLSFGGSWTRPGSDGDGPFQADGQMTFNGLITSGTRNANGGLNFADFLLGYPSAYRIGGSQINDAYVHSPGLYVNDVWRLSRKVTLNFGLRWEPNLAPKDRNGFNVGFSREKFDQGVRSVVYPNAPLGLMFRGDPGFPDNNSNYYNNYNVFSPRFGLVWDPSGDGKQTIRAGFGIYNDTAILWRTAHHPLNSPFGNSSNAPVPSVCPGQPSRNGCPINFLDPWSATPGGDPMVRAGNSRQGDPVQLPPRDIEFPLNGGYVSLPTNSSPMRSYQYNVSYQRQVMDRVLVDITYTGNQQRNIWVGGYAENPSVYVPGNCEAGEYALTAPGPCSNTSAANQRARAVLTLLNPTEGRFYDRTLEGDQIGIQQGSAGGTGHYNGVRFGIQKRLSSGWSANANYTLSKCINTGDPSQDINWTIQSIPEGPDYRITPNYEAEEGACSLDRRHVFNLSSVFVSPGVGGGLVRAITKDWQVGLILQMRSGSPLTPSIDEDRALTGEPDQRPVRVPGVDLYLSKWVAVRDGNGNFDYWQVLNAETPGYAMPGLGERGSTRRGDLYGPGFWNTDLAFSRIVRLQGTQRLELRVEAFNLFNTVNWANPNVNLGGDTYGRITATTGEPRIMQFAVKFGF
jgi:hypothetical protein